MSAFSTTQSQRLESLHHFYDSANGTNVKDDAQFRASFAEAQGLLEMSDQEIADQLSVSRPTVNRWKNGEPAASGYAKAYPELDSRACGDENQTR